MVWLLKAVETGGLVSTITPRTGLHRLVLKVTILVNRFLVDVSRVPICQALQILASKAPGVRAAVSSL